MSCYKEYDKESLEKLQNTLYSMIDDFNKVCEKYDIKYFVSDGTAIGAVRHKAIIPWDDDVDLRMLRSDYEKFVSVYKKELKDKYYILDYVDNDKSPYAFKKFCLANTRFTSEVEYTIGCDFGIFLDIFIMDYVPEDEKKRNKILKKAWFLQKIGLLSKIKKPIILYKGFKGFFIKTACIIIHYLLKICFINANKCYTKAEKLMTSTKESSIIAYAFDTLPLTNVYKIDDLYPLVKQPFGSTYIYLPKEYDKILRDYFGDYMQLPPIEDRKNHYPKILDFGEK